MLQIASEATGAQRRVAFKQGMRELGWIEGKNVEYRFVYADGDVDRLGDLVSELIGQKVEVIVVGGTTAARAAQRTTKTIPIVMTSISNVVSAGLVASLAKPGGNITGITSQFEEVLGKLIGILHEVTPGARRIAILLNESNPSHGVFWAGAHSACAALNLVALARIAFAAVKTKAEDGCMGPRLFVRVKSNLGRDDGGFHYDLDLVDLPGAGAIPAQRLLWRGPVTGEARALLAAAEANNEAAGEDADRKDAVEWLRDLLKDAGGEVVSREAIKLAREAGFSERTVERARPKAGISIRLSGFGSDKRSVWTLPESMRATYPPYPPVSEVGAHGAYAGGDGAQAAREPGIPADVQNDEGAHSAWRITRANGEIFKVRAAPPATRAEMIERYLGSTVEELSGGED